LSDWWVEAVFMKKRQPVVWYSSPVTALPKQRFNAKIDQLRHAALLVAGALRFKHLIDTQRMEIEMKGTKPLDMSQYQRMFTTYRVPFQDCDRLELSSPPNEPSRDVLVIHNNQYFTFNVYDTDGCPFDERKILQQLLRVVDIVTKNYCFTLPNTDSKNAACVEAIRKAVFVLCLDRPLNNSEPYEVACPQQMFVGGRDGENAANRWCDKSLQFIVGEEGHSGLLSDHSPMDGPAVAVLVDHCYNYIFQHEHFDPTSNALKDIPKKLEFQLSWETLQDIEKAKSSHARLRDEMDLLIYKFQNYGKDFVKSRNMSPDSFVQMALQLAFYKIHKVPCATYESASTREFLHGRTEVVRGTSSQSLNFCRTFESPNSTREEKEHSLRKAVAKHKHDANLANSGLGVDRLFFGLKMTAREHGIPLPPFFSEQGYRVSSHFRLFASQVSARCDAVMMLSPIVRDGYCVFYNVLKDSFNFGVSCFNSCPETSALRFKEALEQSLTEMQNCVAQSNPAVGAGT
ncbi:hypothetical protein HPB47_000386, partial [Ixodes persulcatus]